MVDTGIDITHPDLVNNLWINPVEMAGPGATAANGYQNGIDDDGNGESHFNPYLNKLAIQTLMQSSTDHARSSAGELERGASNAEFLWAPRILSAERLSEKLCTCCRHHR